MAENRYLVALINGRSTTSDERVALGSALTDVLLAFEGGAWVGGLAAVTYAELAEIQRDATTVADDAAAEFGYVIAREPAEVPDGSWKAHYVG
jgi:hypothetical protein